MGYISENLMKDETIVYEGRLSVWALAKWLVPGIVMITFIFANAWWGTTVFVLGVGMLLTALIQLATTEMAVTSERVIAKRGWIARRTTEISLSRVEGVEVNQSINQRLLNYGHILVSGVGSHKAKISSVAAPLEFRKAFLLALEQRESGEKVTAGGRDAIERVQVEANRDEKEAEAQAAEVKLRSSAAVEDRGARTGNEGAADFDEELRGLVTMVAGSWVVLDKSDLIDFVVKWKDLDGRALTLLRLNEDADVLTSSIHRPN